MWQDDASTEMIADDDSDTVVTELSQTDDEEPDTLDGLHPHQAVPLHEELANAGDDKDGAMDTTPDHLDDGEALAEHAKLEVDGNYFDEEDADDADSDHGRHTQMLLESKKNALHVTPMLGSHWPKLTELYIKGYLIKLVEVKDGLSPDNVIKACKAKGMMPACNYASHSKGFSNCIPVMDNNWPLANAVYLERVAGDKAATAFHFTFAYQVQTSLYLSRVSHGRPSSALAPNPYVTVEHFCILACRPSVVPWSRPPRV